MQDVDTQGLWVEGVSMETGPICVSDQLCATTKQPQQNNTELQSPQSNPLFKNRWVYWALEQRQEGCETQCAGLEGGPSRFSLSATQAQQTDTLKPYPATHKKESWLRCLATVAVYFFLS